jgi:hypothetical protein
MLNTRKKHPFSFQDFEKNRSISGPITPKRNSRIARGVRHGKENQVRN